MESMSYTRGRKGLFSRVWDMPYGRINQFHLFDAAKNSKEFVQKLQLQTKIAVHTGCVNSISWNDTGKYLLSGSDDQRLSIVHGYNYSVLAYIQTGHRANIFSAKFLPNTNDSHVISCSGDGIIIYSDLEKSDTSINNKFNCHVGTAYEIMTVPNDPNSFLSCGEDRTVRWFDLRTKSSCMNDDCKEDILINCRSPVTSLAVNPLTPYQLAVGCADASVRLFDRRMLGTRATGNVSSNGFQALMACFIVPEFTQSRRITSLCYSGDGEEMLVSYSSDYIYLFDVRDNLEKSPRVLSTDSPTDSPDNDSGLYFQGRSLMKRLRVRGDWSDTGPNARPEAESRATTAENPQASETSSRANRMRWMTDVLTRMFNNNNSTRNPTAVSQSSSASSHVSSQSEASEMEVSDSNEEERVGAPKEEEDQTKDPKTDAKDPDTKPSTSKTAKSVTRKISEKTKDKLKSIACCALGSPEPSTSFDSSISSIPVNEPTTSKAEVDLNFTEPKVSSEDLIAITVPTIETKPEDLHESLENLEQELTSRRSDLIEKHHSEPMVNLHYSGQSVSSGLITMDVSTASTANERQWHEQSQNPDNDRDTESANNNTAADVSSNSSLTDVNSGLAVDVLAFAQLAPPDEVDKPQSPVPQVTVLESSNSTPIPSSNQETSESEVDEAIQSIQPNIPQQTLESSSSGSVNTRSPLRDEGQSSSSQLAEGDVALMMEVDSWDVDSDDELARPTSPQQSDETRRESGDNKTSDSFYQSLADEVELRNEELKREEAHMANVSHPRVKRKYTGHRNARTMIKEATFWGNNFIMSGSDCGHIFIWDRLSTELVMMMEADHHVVNCLQPHPFDPVLASSGIDYDIKLWAPTREEPVFDEEKANEMIKRNEVMLEETKDTITVPASFMIRMLNTLNHFRFSHGNNWSRAAREARAANTDSNT